MSAVMTAKELAEEVVEVGAEDVGQLAHALLLEIVVVKRRRTRRNQLAALLHVLPYLLRGGGRQRQSGRHYYDFIFLQAAGDHLVFGDEIVRHRDGLESPCPPDAIDLVIVCYAE